MDNNPQLQQQQLAIKLLVILATGLVSALLLGLLLYIDDRQGSFNISTLMADNAYLALLLAGVCMVSIKRYWHRNSLKNDFRIYISKMRLQLGLVAVHLNRLLFAVLAMTLLLSTRAGSLDTQQLFFIALLSAMTGLLLARAWAGLTGSNGEA